MKKLLSFYEFINEGVHLENGKYIFNFTDDKEGDIMSLKFMNYKGKSLMHNYYYCYEFDNNRDKDFLKNLKYYSDLIDAQYSVKFIDKGIAGLNRQYPLNQFDSIVYPKSSSRLLADFAIKCSEKSGNAELIPDAFVKQIRTDIQFDMDKIESISDEKTKKQIYKAIDAIKNAEGDFRMKEVFSRYRKFVKDFLIFNSEEDRHINNLITNKKVLLIDDYRTSGTTMKEMMDKLFLLEPNQLTVCVIIKVV
jgi:hypothetical protein